MSGMVRALVARRDAWPHLADVYQWAVHEAREADHRADAAAVSVNAGAGIQPAYPPIVELLAAAPWTDETCPHCDGTGAMPLGDACPACDGSGERRPGADCPSDCPFCDGTGTGQPPDEPCSCGYMPMCSACGHLSHSADGCGHPEGYTHVRYCECRNDR